MPEHGLQQSRPVGEAEPLRQEAQGLEELAPRARCLAALPPQLGDAVQHGMQRKSEQVQRGEQVGQPVAPVPEVALLAHSDCRNAIRRETLPCSSGLLDEIVGDGPTGSFLFRMNSSSQ